MTLRLEFDRHQSRALREAQPGTICTYPWGRGSGKTFFGRGLIHLKALEQPGRHVGLLLPTLKQARQVFWPALFADFEGPLRRRIRGRANRTLLEVTYENGSRLTTWGAENAGGIRGQRFDVLIEDESDDVDPDVEQAVVRPTFSRAGMKALWVKFGTPRRGRSGSLYRSYRKALARVPGYRGFRVRSSESPQVDQAWLAQVAADTPPDILKREYEVDFDAAGGLVYGEVFNEPFHVREPPPGAVANLILFGGDHGWEDPGVLLNIALFGSGREAVGYVVDEIYERHRTEDWWTERGREWFEWYPNHRFFADPSQPARVEAFRQKGARVQDVDNSIDDGVSAVADRFFTRHRLDAEGNRVGEPFSRLYVSPRCINLLTELGCDARTYEGRKPLDGIGPYMRKRDPDNPERFLDEIVDKNNHGCDALRYAIFNHFGKPDRSAAGMPHDAI